MVITIERIAYHRNGIGGNGFHVVCFCYQERDDMPAVGFRRMVGIVFVDEPGSVAVLDRDQTANAEIRFAGGNSWRGDNFEPLLRKAIEDYEQIASEEFTKPTPEDYAARVDARVSNRSYRT